MATTDLVRRIESILDRARPYVLVWGSLCLVVAAAVLLGRWLSS